MTDWSSLSDLGVPLLRVLPRLLVAIALGALLGWNRERQAKPAGLRTHMMVTLGSASFVLMAFELGAELLDREGKSSIDPTRVLQGVVGGIGFLGAGCIMQAKGHVEGVTTAASVWVCGAVGAAAGAGGYLLAISTAVLAFIILSAIGKLEDRLRPANANQAPNGSIEDPHERANTAAQHSGRSD